MRTEEVVDVIGYAAAALLRVKPCDIKIYFDRLDERFRYTFAGQGYAYAGEESDVVFFEFRVENGELMLKLKKYAMSTKNNKLAWEKIKGGGGGVPLCP